MLSQKKKKILFMANHFSALFATRKELIRRLLEDGHDVYLSIPDDENEYFKKLGCTIIITKIERRGKNIIKDFFLLLRYYRIVTDIKPDIIFSYTIKPNIYGSFVSKNKYKQICNITGTGGTFMSKTILSEFSKFLYRCSVRHSYKVFFQNSGDRDFFIKNKLIKDRYELLPGSGCNIKEYTLKPMPDFRVIRFIFIGRIMSIKGIEEYIEAARIIKDKYSNTEFSIAGWNEEKKYKKLILENEQKGIVKYIGHRNDIADIIASKHCVILPSHGGEGVPNVLLESSAIGRACIASDIDGSRDAVEDGVTGYLFEPRNIEDLVDKIEKFLSLSNTEKVSMGKNGRDKIVLEFNREFIVEKYCKEVDIL